MRLKSLDIVIIFFLFVPLISMAQNTPDFYISNQGKDIFPGTSPLLPRKTITATAPLLTDFAKRNGRVKVALESGGIFDETLVASYPIEVTTYPGKNGNTGFAVLDGSKEFTTGWVKDSGTTNIYKQEITYTGFTGGGIGNIENYSFIYVTEVDRALEKTQPFTARKVLTFYNSLQQVGQNPGSFYAPYSPINYSGNTLMMSVHASDGSSPNSNAKYRYEVTVRDWGVNSYWQPVNVFKNLWVHGFGAGNGMLPGGDNSSYDKIIFGPGAGIHHVVVRSGVIDHSLFLPSAKNTGEYAVVFYDADGLRRHCTIKNSIFLDIPKPIYMHTSSSGTNYSALEINNTIAFADTSNPQTFFYTSNNDSVLLNNVYTDGFNNGYNSYGTAKYAAFRNCYFKDVAFYGIGYSGNPVNSIVNSCFIKTKNVSFTMGIFIQAGALLQLTNSVIHVNGAAANSAFVYGAGAPGSKINASGNIFICDNGPGTTLYAASYVGGNANSVSGDKWDNNVYVLLNGDKIEWYVTVPGPNGLTKRVVDFEGWKKQSGQDAHSLFFDLRNDPRGLRAIFVDPSSGDYELANTPEGNKIAALGAGMNSPITCFIKKPTYEQAADLIRNNEILSINSCRNPCTQNRIRVNHTMAATVSNYKSINISWNIAEQQNTSRYILQKATVNSIFRSVATIPVGKDTSYSYTDDDIMPGVPYQYRLVLIAGAGNTCYSDIKAVKTVSHEAFSLYPNPSNGKFMIYMNGYLGKVKYTILNANGQNVISNEFFTSYGPRPLDFTGISKGIYFIKIETPNAVSIQKFIKE
ncbi:MAG: T9SS type A sorting domain-containing protein [Ginsengibacter sp.]